MGSTKRQTRITKSSGNVFQDLGLAHADALMAKAQLASTINDILERRRLTQAATAQLLGITRPRVSRLRRGHLDEFSFDCLMGLLTQLGRDIKVVVGSKRRSRGTGSIQVAG